MIEIEDAILEIAALREENARLRAGSPVLHKDRDVVLHYKEIEEENARLTADHEELGRLCHQYAESDAKWADALAAANAHVAALVKYARHDPECCDAWGVFMDSSCNCGLDALLDAGETP